MFSGRPHIHGHRDVDEIAALNEHRIASNKVTHGVLSANLEAIGHEPLICDAACVTVGVLRTTEHALGLCARSDLDPH